MDDRIASVVLDSQALDGPLEYFSVNDSKNRDRLLFYAIQNSEITGPQPVHGRPEPFQTLGMWSRGKRPGLQLFQIPVDSLAAFLGDTPEILLGVFCQEYVEATHPALPNNRLGE